MASEVAYRNPDGQTRSKKTVPANHQITWDLSSVQYPEIRNDTLLAAFLFAVPQNPSRAAMIQTFLPDDLAAAAVADDSS
jgi:hypothetical protein